MGPLNILSTTAKGKLSRRWLTIVVNIYGISVSAALQKEPNFPSIQVYISRIWDSFDFIVPGGRLRSVAYLSIKMCIESQVSISNNL